MNRLIASEWETLIPQGEGEKRSVQYLVPENGFVDFSIRSVQPLEVNAITKEGESHLLAWGQFASWKGVLDGYAFLEVVTSSSFAIRNLSRPKWLEVPDPVPLALVIDEAASKPMADLVRAELAKLLAQKQTEAAIRSDVDIEELVDDIFNGDHEFEREPDPFGLGFEEPDEDDEPELPLGPAEPNAPGGTPGAPAPAPATTPPPDGSKTPPNSPST